MPPVSDRPVDLTEDLALAQNLAAAADLITLPRFGATDLSVSTKPDLTPVTDADTAVETEIRRLIEEQRPADAIHGEEFGGAAPSGRTWVIDPIDGTKNFVRGLPVWATLVSLTLDGVPLVGVVSAPALGRTWWAARGSGAWTAWTGSARNPRRLTVSRIDRVEDASISYSSLGGWGDRRGSFEGLLDSASRSRAYGDFYSHMLVAEGAVDIAAEPDLAVWDIAAVIPIVEEAGGRVTGVDGGAVPGPAGALSTNSSLHDAALRFINA